MAFQFPLIDLGAFERASGDDRARVAATVDHHCRATGFLIVAGHGVSPTVISNLWTASQKFFALPQEIKLEAAPRSADGPYGYHAMGIESLARSKGAITLPDLKESFSSGPLVTPAGLTDPEALAFCYAGTPWPARPERFREAWEAYYNEMQDLAARLMRLFAVALALPESAFENAITAPISALRAVNYPATGPHVHEQQFRAGAHTDYGTLTILWTEPGISGFEILMQELGWTEVGAMDGAFLVNIGDLMARWTNDRWRSTLHRVVARPDAPCRQSLVYFHQPNWDYEVACLPSCAIEQAPLYTPVRSGQYLMQKFKSTIEVQ